MKHIWRTYRFLVAMVFLIGIGGVSAGLAQELTAQRSVSDAERIASLEEKLKVMEERLALLETRLGESAAPLVASNGAIPVGAIPQPVEPASQAQQGRQVLMAQATPSQAAPAATAPPIVGAGQEGFSLRSGNGDFRLNIRYQLNVDSRFSANRQDPSEPNSIYLRRIQPILEGTVYRRFDYRVMTEFAQGRPRVNDVYFDTMFWPALRLRAGKFKGPVGLERLMSGMVLPFTERSFPSQLVPNRDPGLQLFGDLAGGRLSYAVGVFNGVPDGVTSDGDSDDNKEFEGRIFSHPFRGSSLMPLEGLGIGLGGSYGRLEGTTAAPNVPKYVTTGQRTIFQFRSDATTAGTVIAEGVHHRIAPQAYYYYGPFGLMGEYTVSVQDVRRGATAATLKNSAWQVQSSYVLTGERASYNGVTPAQIFEPERNTWGALELTARYSQLRVDRGAFPVFADSSRFARGANAWALGLNWYMNRMIKMVFDYEQTDLKEAAPGVPLKKENLFMQRMQLRF